MLWSLYDIALPLLVTFLLGLLLGWLLWRWRRQPISAADLERLKAADDGAAELAELQSELTTVTRQRDEAGDRLISSDADLALANSRVVALEKELKSVVEELRTEFSDFEFDGASSVLNDEQMLILDQMFDTMFLYEDLLVTMGVNAFELDSAEQNLSLSQQRADSITDYLTGLGLESNKYLVIGRGDTLRVSDSSNTPGIILSFGQK